jgi:hypothetical protein
VGPSDASTHEPSGAGIRSDDEETLRVPPAEGAAHRHLQAVPEPPADLDTNLIDCARKGTSPPQPAGTCSPKTLRQPPRPVTVVSDLFASGPRYRGSNPCLPAIRLRGLLNARPLRRDVSPKPVPESAKPSKAWRLRRRSSRSERRREGGPPTGDLDPAALLHLRPSIRRRTTLSGCRRAPRRCRPNTSSLNGL